MVNQRIGQRPKLDFRPPQLQFRDVIKPQAPDRFYSHRVSTMQGSMPFSTMPAVSELKIEEDLTLLHEGLYTPMVDDVSIDWIHFTDFSDIRFEGLNDSRIYVKLGDYMIHISVFTSRVTCRSAWHNETFGEDFPMAAWEAKVNWVGDLLSDYSTTLSNDPKQWEYWSNESDMHLELALREVAFRNRNRRHDLRLMLAKGAVKPYPTADGELMWPRERLDTWIQALLT